MPPIDPVVAFLDALAFVPAILLALAAAPLARDFATGVLLTLNLAVLVEILHALIEPGHGFAGAPLARLLASATQVAGAVWLLQRWRGPATPPSLHEAGD